MKRNYLIPKSDRCMFLESEAGMSGHFTDGPHTEPKVSVVVGARLCYEDGTELPLVGA